MSPIAFFFFFVFKTQEDGKQFFAASCIALRNYFHYCLLKWIVNTVFTVHVNSGNMLHCSGRIESGSKLNALNRVRLSKIKNKKFYFLFLVVFY